MNNYIEPLVELNHKRNALTLTTAFLTLNMFFNSTEVNI